jgi:hypothetical protein
MAFGPGGTAACSMFMESAMPASYHGLALTCGLPGRLPLTRADVTPPA